MQSISAVLKQISRAGPPALPNDSQCPQCGYFDTTHPEVRHILLAYDPTGQTLRMARCRCEERQLAADQQRRQQANLPHPKTPRTFETFAPRPGTEAMVDACRNFVGRQGPAVVMLCGEPGTGKTHMLEAVGRAILDQGRSVRYEFTPTLIDKLRFTYRDASTEDIAELMGWYARFAVLLLDDPGAERVTDFAVEKITELVNTRLLQESRLLVATNLTREEFKSRTSARLASRLFQGNPKLDEVLVVTNTATDYRT